MKPNVSRLKRLVCEYYPMFAVLAGFVLVAYTLGPFTNGDTAWELDATSGVLKTGLPLANGHYLIDQPPVGFYVQAAIGSVFGVSSATGTVLTTLAGLGCIILVYIVGRILYDSLTGVLAAALFAFTPWHLILSRAFLIDVQCLFFSLLSLTVAIFALRRSSFGMFFLSGLIFAVAFNTKLYAVFTLIPLLALFMFHRPKKPAQAAKWLLAFGLPTLVSAFLWYQVITGTSMASIILHTDFAVHNTGAVAPSYFFTANFLINYGVGWLLLDAVLFGAILGFALWRRQRGFLIVGAICIAMVAAVVGVDTFLGVTLNLKPPYQNAIKYCYQALPYLALLAASLVRNSLTLTGAAKNSSRLKKVGAWLVGAAGLVLVTGALCSNMHYITLVSTVDFMIFRVQPMVNVGYSFFIAHPDTYGSTMMFVQYAGFGLAWTGLFWLSRNRLKSVLTRKPTASMPESVGDA